MMGFILSRSFSVLLLAYIALFSKVSISEGKLSFSFTSSTKNASFKSEDIALYGDAKLVDGGSSIQLSDSVSQGGGRVVYKKTILFMDTVTEYRSGFSTVFSLSISPGRGGRIGFVVFPVNETFGHSSFQVKLDIPENFTKSRDSNVSVILDGASDEIRNFTIANLGEKEKEKLLLYAWINYQASGKFLEVRLSKSQSFKSVDPLMFTWIDLSEMLKDEDEFLVGVKSYSGNFNLHSWSLETRRVFKPEPSYDPLFYMEMLRQKEAAKKRRREKKIKETVTCFVMTFGSTGLVFFAMMHIWAAFKRNNLAMVMQEECGIKTKEVVMHIWAAFKMEVVMSKAAAQEKK